MSNKGEKKSGIGAFDFFCIGFGAIVGVGWAVSINGWMGKSGGPIPAAVGYLIALVMMVPVGLCYCELCPMLPVAGGGAAYAYRAFGEKVSFISGWAAFGGFVVIIPWEAIMVVDILSIMFPVIKAGEPLYMLADTGIYAGHLILGVLISFFIFFINYRGLSTSASVQRILCILLIGAGLLAMIAALMKFDAKNLEPIYQNVGRGNHKGFLGGAIAILASAPFFLAGFETIPQGVEEAGGSITSVGKTVVLSVGLACVFYAALLFTLGSAMPWQNFINPEIIANPAASNMMKLIYDNAFGRVLYYIILTGAICGLLTTWNGFMGASPRLLMSMARANMVPKFFAKENPKTGVPVNGLLCCLGLSLMGPFLGMGLIDPLTNFSSGCFVTSWLLTSASLVRLRQTEPDLPRPYKIPGGSAMGWFSTILMAGLFVLLFIPGNPVFMGKEPLTIWGSWMVIGLVLFIASGPQRRALPPEERAAALFAKMN